MTAAQSDSQQRARPLRVAIVGGGLAGLATAAALADSRLQRESDGSRLEIELFESRRMLGGRATSYRDPESGELIDNCQHVTLGCCTNFDDFCRRTGIDRLFTRGGALNFIGPDGRVNVVRRSRWLPAPLHLAPSLVRLGYLTLRERVNIARALRRLARSTASDTASRLTFAEWLRREGQSERAIQLFWSPVVVSALSEDVDRAGFAVSRKVFVDAFLRHKRGYEMKLPKVPLRTLYDEYLVRWLEERGVRLRLGTDVRAIEAIGEKAGSLVLADDARHPFDFFCIAVPWHRVGELLESGFAGRLPLLRGVKHLEGVPITSVHLRCKHKIGLRVSHAALPGRFSQWVFDRTSGGSDPYYQVVISASREVASMSRGDVVARVCRELEDVCGEPVGDLVTAAKVITEHRAVFSPTPESDQWRPAQCTPIPNLFLAGDWTDTGWPATMEGAVRSGYLAAEALLETVRAGERVLKPDVPAAPLARWLLSVR